MFGTLWYSRCGLTSDTCAASFVFSEQACKFLFTNASVEFPFLAILSTREFHRKSLDSKKHPNRDVAEQLPGFGCKRCILLLLEIYSGREIFYSIWWDYTPSATYQPITLVCLGKAKVSSLWKILWYNKALTASNLSVHTRSSCISKTLMHRVLCLMAPLKSLLQISNTQNRLWHTATDLLESHDLIQARVLPCMP